MDDVTERLAEQLHDEWSEWVQHLLSGMSLSRLKLLETDALKSFNELTKAQQDNYRRWATRYLKLVMEARSDETPLPGPVKVVEGISDGASSWRKASRSVPDTTRLVWARDTWDHVRLAQYDPKHELWVLAYDHSLWDGVTDWTEAAGISWEG